MSSKLRGRIGILATAVLALLVISLPGTASAKDRNKDRIPDRWERTHQLSLKKDQRKLDQDRDGLRNRGEWRAGTSPRDKDSDDDGVTDLKEKAGVISAYDEETGELTLTLYQGGEITGSVTDQTRVKCESDEVPGDEGTPGDDDGTEDQGSGDAFRHGDDESGDDESGDSGPSGDGRGHEEHGNGQGRGHDKHGCGGDCSTDDLAEGVEVTEAEVKFTASGKVFKELEIVVPSAEE